MPSPVVFTIRPWYSGDLGIDELDPDPLRGLQRALFVVTHQSAVSYDVGGEDRGESAIYLGFYRLFPREMRGTWMA
ncbi:hypothetical protein BH18GEM1_BH18GEM1_13990 [soil metagenome]